MQPLFGTGLAVLTPNLGGSVTPIVVAALQDISLDASFKVVDLLGNLQFAIDKAKGEGKLGGKFKTGYFSGGLINAILSGSTVVAGSTVAVFSEQGTVPTTPYQLVTTKGALTTNDLGVFDVTANKFLTRVAAAPTTGQYSMVEATGTYTFAAADTTHIMQYSYGYTAASVGTTIQLNNQMMGTNTTFGFRLFNNYSAAAGGANIANSAGIYVPVVTIPKLSLAFKNTGFTEQSVDFECSANAAGQVATLWTGN